MRPTQFILFSFAALVLLSACASAPKNTLSADEYYRRRLDSLNKEADAKRAEKIDPRYDARMGFTSERIIAPLEDEMTAAGYGDPGYGGYLAGVEPRPFEHVRGRSLVGNKTTTTYTFDDWGNPQMIVEQRGVYRDSFAPKVEYLGGPPAPRRGSVERIQGETIVIRDESE